MKAQKVEIETRQHAEWESQIRADERRRLFEIMDNLKRRYLEVDQGMFKQVAEVQVHFLSVLIRELRRMAGGTE